ncbi:MAG: monovalent cation/H+ antiporter complex subunit F [bacterium]
MIIDFISLLKCSVVILSVTIFFCLYRAILGPTVADQIIGINVVGSKSIIILVLLAAIFQKNSYLDIALLYAMLLYISTLGFIKYLEGRNLGD